MKKETKKEIEDKAKLIIREAKSAKQQYEKEAKQTFPLKDFIDQISENHPVCKDFSKQAKKKAKDLAKFL